MSKINAFILAAGLGERLSPITTHFPKPLMPVLGKPVVEHVLDRLSSLPLREIGMNLHYKKEMIEEWASRQTSKKRLTLFHEEEILGTGGALKNAEEFLRQSTFIVHNSDILTDINLEELLEFHNKSKNLVTLSTHDCPEFNCLVVDPNGLLKNIEKGGSLTEDNDRVLAFTGIAVYEPKFLDYLPEGRSDVVSAWLEAIKEGQRIGVYQSKGSRWNDIGTPEAYASALFERLRDDGEVVYIDKSSSVAALDLEGYGVIERDCDIGERVMLRNSILLPGTKLGKDSEMVHQLSELKVLDGVLQIENSIIGPGFLIKLDESELKDLHGESGEQFIGAGGSDRRFLRVHDGAKTSVLMKCKSDDSEFTRHVEYSGFFLSHSVPVPKLIDSDTVKKEAYFEDGGDISLYTYLKFHSENKEIEDIYKKVIDALILIHTKATEDVSSCPLLKDRVFDYDHFKWETGYFLENFTGAIGGLQVQDEGLLEKELQTLARKADSFDKTIMHLDFQSQNIMVPDGDRILIIDFQGAGLGPPAYDIASMLWDPYYRLDDLLRQYLVDYYIHQMKRQNSSTFDEDTFRESLLPCRLQRHMQALGAYGFLSLVKGKKYFLKHTTEGFRLLTDEISLSRVEYPELYELIMSFDESLIP
ncbi:MAG: sugar phosphate nucleotidyltransferase [Thermodesulfobacteriota bacterium]